MMKFTMKSSNEGRLVGKRRVAKVQVSERRQEFRSSGARIGQLRLNKASAESCGTSPSTLLVSGRLPRARISPKSRTVAAAARSFNELRHAKPFPSPVLANALNSQQLEVKPWAFH
jgi:hypothetical protein